MKTIISALILIFTLGTTYTQVKTTATTSTQTIQVKKSILKTYPHYMITPYGGAIFPMPKTLNQSFKPGAFVGLDAMVRVNREVGIYLDGAVYFMKSKIDGAPIGTYFQYSGGPRYIFTKRNLKSQIFAEIGVGGYTFIQKSYSDPNILGGYTEDVVNTRVGVNGGLGADLALSDAVGIVVKAKYHTVFTDKSNSSFVTASAGIGFRFR